MIRTSDLRADLIRIGETITSAAKAIGISSYSLSMKIKNKREFKLSEIVKLSHFLGLPSIASFFDLYVEKI